ncbi:MAG: CHAT domain-containing protein [Mycobacterium sp.]
MAVTSGDPLTLVLRFADLGVATYASLRVVGQPWRTVTWVVAEPIVLAAVQELAGAIPDPQAAETTADAIERAVTRGGFAHRDRELTLAYILGVLLIAAEGWRLLGECVSDPRAVLFVAPSARLAAVPWGLLAVPTSGPTAEELLRARAAAITTRGTTAARLPWQLADITEHTDGHRLLELVDVLMALPANVTNAARPRHAWTDRRDAPAVLVLDPRVPGQRPDSELGSVLGRPTADGRLTHHVAELTARSAVLPDTVSAVDLFRRSDADRHWLQRQLNQAPGRLLFVGHASAADGDLGTADRAALHLACAATVPGLAEPIGAHRPLSAADVRALQLRLPPRVALLACGSGGDYRFDEATGLVAAMVLGGAQLVTATLWTLPTTAGFRRFAADPTADPMVEVVIAVDAAHGEDDAGRAVCRWQRGRLRQWRAGDSAASPLYWAALVTFAVDGAR